MSLFPELSLYRDRVQPILDVDLNAISANWHLLNDLSGTADTGAVLKADAYGLGCSQIAQALFAAGCRTYFVAYPSEAPEVRRAVGPDAHIFVLHGPDRHSLTDILEADAIPILSTPQHIEVWRPLGAPAALQFDTGMNRLGFRPGQLEWVQTKTANMPIVMVMSHLACADEPDHPMNAAQRTAFEVIADAFPQAEKSLSNTAGACLGPAYHFDLIRPGIGLYGGYAAANFCPSPTARLSTPLLNIFTPHENDPAIACQSAGYGASAPINRGQRIGVISLGYADGALRSLSNSGRVLIDDHEVPILGRVSMDLITLDLSAAPSDLQIGDRVELFGPGINIADQAKRAGTISYELFTALGHRIQKTYHGRVTGTG